MNFVWRKKVEQFGENSAVSYIPGAEILTFKTQGDDEGIGLGDTDSDDEWVDVSHSDNEMDTEEENNKAVNKSTDGNKEEEKVFSTKDALKEVMKLTAKERAARAADVVSSRFLSDADFAKIAAVQAAKEVEMFSNSRKNKKRKRAVENKAESGELVSLKSIEMIYKKRKHNKDARMETIMGGREGRDKFGAKRGRMNPNASTTNREKFKTKSFMMVKYKVAGKQKRSFREKQIRLRNSLLKQKKNY